MLSSFAGFRNPKITDSSTMKKITTNSSEASADIYRQASFADVWKVHKHQYDVISSEVSGRLLTGFQITSLLAIRLISLSRLKMNAGPRPQLSKGPLSGVTFVVLTNRPHTSTECQRRRIPMTFVRPRVGTHL